MGVKINTARTLTVASMLKPLGNVIKKNLVEVDPQYRAVQLLVDFHGYNLTSLLVILNSVISYQLNLPGEEYWSKFAEFFSRVKGDVDTELFKQFLTSVKCTRLVDQKIKRIERLLRSKLAAELRINGLFYCSNIKDLSRNIARTLNTKVHSKTVVFASKMYGYVCHSAGIEPNYSDLPIPVDYRNALLALTSCILESDIYTVDIKKCAMKFTGTQYAHIIQKAWSIICDESGIPCLLLDTFTWLFTREAMKAGFSPRITVEFFNKNYGVSIPVEVAITLLECAEKRA